MTINFGEILDSIRLSEKSISSSLNNRQDKIDNFACKLFKSDWYVQKKQKVENTTKKSTLSLEVNKDTDDINSQKKIISKQINNKEINSLQKFDHFILSNIDTKINNRFDILFIALFPQDYSQDGDDLLSKMIAATKISKQSYFIMYIYKETTLEQIEQIIGSVDVSYIVSFGAKATNIFFDESKKIKEIHGTFIQLKKFNSQLFPVFHPDFLNINKSMKKMAWEDLLKLMKKLNINL